MNVLKVFCQTRYKGQVGKGTIVSNGPFTLAFHLRIPTKTTHFTQDRLFSLTDRPLRSIFLLNILVFSSFRKSQGNRFYSDADNLVHSLAYFPDKLEVVDFAADFQKEICFHFSSYKKP